MMAEGNDVEPDIFDPVTQQDVDWAEKHKREADEKGVRAILEARKGAYYRVFEAGVPSKADKELVKADLQKFCRFNTTTFHENDRVHCMLTGRQEAYLRIDDFTRLSVDALVIKYTQPPEV